MGIVVMLSTCTMKPFTLHEEEGKNSVDKGHHRSENDMRDLRAEIGSLPLAKNAQHSPTSYELTNYQVLCHYAYSAGACVPIYT